MSHRNLFYREVMEFRRFTDSSQAEVVSTTTAALPVRWLGGECACLAVEEHPKAVTA